MDAEEEDLPRFAPRFYNLAVRRLGYTHGEAGMRRLGQLMDELSDLIALETETQQGPEDFGWITNNRKEVL